MQSISNINTPVTEGAHTVYYFSEQALYASTEHGIYVLHSILRQKRAYLTNIHFSFRTNKHAWTPFPWNKRVQEKEQLSHNTTILRNEYNAETNFIILKKNSSKDDGCTNKRLFHTWPIIRMEFHPSSDYTPSSSHFPSLFAGKKAPKSNHWNGILIVLL